jgi:hypothetical protein
VAVAAATDGARNLRAVRVWWRAGHPPPSLGKRLDRLYTVAIVGAIFGALVYGTASSALAQVVSPHWLGVFGPSLALVALLLAAQWGAYQGPVVFTVADVPFLLGAPLPRRALAIRRMLLSLAVGAGVGAVVAAILLVGLAGEGRGVEIAESAGLVLGLAELATLGVAAAWAVQRSARIERYVRLATWPVVLAGAALAAAAGSERKLALWSGPWGWAVQPAAGGARGAALAGLAALTAVTAAAVAGALRDCGGCSAERHLVRAEARAGAIAALTTFDARTARRSLDAAGGRALRRSAGDARGLRDLIGPRAPIVWRGAVAFIRAPGRVAEATALAAGGIVLCLLDADEILAVPAGMFLVYLGAARLLWPLRAELDVPGRTATLLRQRAGRVLREHALLPALVVALSAALAALGCAVAGALPEHGAAVALAAIAVTPAVTACAGMSARRGGRLPQSLLMTAVAGDPGGGGGTIIAWLAAWPLTAAVLGGLPVLLAAGGGPGVLPPALFFALAAAAVLGLLLGRDPAQP